MFEEQLVISLMAYFIHRFKFLSKSRFWSHWCTSQLGLESESDSMQYEKFCITQECIPVGCVPADRWPYSGICCFSGVGGGVPGQVLPPPPWTEWMTDRCKNITLAKTSFRPVTMYPSGSVNKPLDIFQYAFNQSLTHYRGTSTLWHRRKILKEYAEVLLNLWTIVVRGAISETIICYCRKLQHSFLKGESEEAEPGSRKQPIQLPTSEPEFDRPSLANAPASPPV